MYTYFEAVYLDQVPCDNFLLLGERCPVLLSVARLQSVRAQKGERRCTDVAEPGEKGEGYVF